MVTTRRERDVVPLMPGRNSEKTGKHSGECDSVLVVEDDARTLRLERFVLEDEGYEVVPAGSGEEALSLVTESQPSLVLLDIGLPGMDGFSACAQIRQVSQVPIIMVTGRDSDWDKVRGLEIGADDYLTKPFSPNELATRVKVLLRRNGSAYWAGYDPPSVRPDGAEQEAAQETPVEAPEGGDHAGKPVESGAEHMQGPVPGSDGYEQLYEGTVRLMVESTGNAKDVITFVSELRQNPQFRLLRLVASQHKEGMDIWLGLREPLPLKDMLLQIQGVCRVESSATEPDAEEAETLAVSLKED